jgi:hypothetical protein
MHIQFDEKNIHVQVICGALESHTPSRKMKMIVEKTEKLKQEMAEFIEDIVKPEMEAIKKMVEQENEKHKKKVDGTTSEEAGEES